MRSCDGFNVLRQSDINYLNRIAHEIRRHLTSLVPETGIGIIGSYCNTFVLDPFEGWWDSPGVPFVSANEKVNIAFIGIGNRGGEIAKELYKTGLCNVVALCDVDMGAKHTQELISMFPKVPRYQDFRKMFDQMADKIDAVTVGVPDHAHFPITIEAMAHGKHVYVEKPMARTFQEIELMMRGEKKYGVVTQMGNQGHSEANYFQFKAWKEAGLIKDVTAITAHMNSPRRWHGWNPNIKHMPMGEPIPETMDWDTWLGVVQHHDYNHDYHMGQWRCWYDFGMGALGDWGAHILDTAHEFLDMGLPNRDLTRCI